ncbi:MAG: carboxypeptidase regulatory-like domain-containing protein [Gemmatimonadaceae bacterium]
MMLSLTGARTAFAQVTTGAMTGTVSTERGALAGARVMAVHEPSGTTYQATSRADGRFTIPGMRVGGPYTVSALALGYEKTTQRGLEVTLGATTDVTFSLKVTAVTLTGVQVTASGGSLSSNVTGAATTITKEALQALPTIGRTITDFTRLTPQSAGSSFAGQDNRLNNFTLDGSAFNNSFGLGSQPGARTGVSPIPIDAIEQLQVNVAPFDVRQGSFTGAGVNAVTKSGTNEFKSSVYYTLRNQGLQGDSTAGLFFNKGTYKFAQPGGWVSGPIIRNKLFFFVNYDEDALNLPATTYTANTGTQPITGNVTRVLQSDLDQLSKYLKDNFGYETGPYQGYNFQIPSQRFIGKIDYNINERNKFSLRYSMLNSQSDQPVSNSGSFGNSAGGRINNANSMSFSASNYAIMENIRSTIGELNSQIGSNMSNQIIAGVTSNDESRKYKGSFFPLVDILNNGSNYVSFGFEPFTPSNILTYKTLQFQDNFTIYADKHEFAFGISAQKYNSENGFAPGLQSGYVYNSLADFYTDANDYLANKGRTASPVTLRRFQVRYANIPGQTTPLQPLEVYTYGGYAQDDWRVTKNLKVTYGLRFDLPSFSNTAFANPQADALSFRDQAGKTVSYSSGKLPNANLLISPRVGINWDAKGDRSFVVRGGTGIFSGVPPYVWVSNQLGNTGVLTGLIDQSNTKAYPFNPDPAKYKPATVTGAPAAAYELDVADPKYTFSQVWRTDIAVDHKLPFGFVGTLEALYNREMNGAYYINANLPAPVGNFTGADQRMRWNTANNANRINPNISAAFVLSNANTGYSYNLAASLERQFRDGLFVKAAYSYGVSKNSFDPGSTASSNWGANATANDPNNPGVQFSQYSPGHRAFLALSYRHEYFKFGATSISLFTQGFTQGNTSYTFSADANGDGATNDLIYIPRNASEMNFQQYAVTTNGVTRTFTVAEQQAVWESYIQQDKYLNSRRGQYAVRNAVFLPVMFRSDLGITQELFQNLGGKRNTLSLRLDILNLDNLINKKWGAGTRLVSSQPLLPQGPDANGALLYRLRNIGTDLLSTSYQHTANSADVWRMQLGLRYTFN